MLCFSEKWRPKHDIATELDYHQSFFPFLRIILADWQHAKYKTTKTTQKDAVTRAKPI